MTIPGFAQLNLIGKIISVVAPLAVIAALWFGAQHMLSNAHADGAESRQVEIDAQAQKIAGLEAKLKIQTGLKDAAERRVIELSGQIIADAAEYAASIKAQADVNRAAQDATADAMRAMARQKSGHEEWLAGLNDQLKDVTYGQDQDGRCVIRGGGRVLRNAAKGKN